MKERKRKKKTAPQKWPRDSSKNEERDDNEKKKEMKEKVK